ncbi:transglycosylase SLT domain-containing protein [Chromobacterium subtsugae]|uniref:transglycosylase SLT domain-containing protein n=1 Tax=Chromobacterium subtsugae TaxID=251747 RepID=UPI000AC1B3C4|nr:transglycosylase SLT domain-containing protein [Chromobacterium subtsugae]
MANRLDPLFHAAAARYGIDPDLLRAVQMQENPKGNLSAVGPVPAVGDPNDRAIGLMQIRQSIANKLGIDPRDPAQAIDGAAQLLAGSLQRNGGDPEMAVTEYHGGTNPANWGPRTQDYVSKVAGYFQQLKQQPQPQMAQAAKAAPPPAGADPIMAALSGTAAPAAAGSQGQSDPILAALQSKSPVPVAQTKAAKPATPATDNVATTLSAVLPGGLGKDLANSGVGDFIRAGQHHLLNPVLGASQLLDNGVDAGLQMLPDNPVSRYWHGVTQNNNAYMAQREQQYQANTPTNAASVAGAAIGDAAPFLASGGASLLGRAGSIAERLPLVSSSASARRIANAVAQGATVGAMQPVTNAVPPTMSDLITGQGSKAPSYWQEKALQTAIGGAIGGAVSGAANGARGLYQAAKPVISPRATAADTLAAALRTPAQSAATAPAVEGAGASAAAPAGAAGPAAGTASNAADLAAALRTPAQQFVPGSRPTLAQVLQTPQAVQLEKAVSNLPQYRAMFEQRAIENNAARLQAIQGVAGTPDAMAGAIQARQDAAGPLYAAARQESYVPDSTLTDLLSTPAGASALQRARQLAANSMDRAPIITDDGDLTGTGGHYMKMAFDAMLDEGQRTGMAGAEQNAIRNLRGNFLDWLDTQSPNYASARQSYRDASVPISDMEAGQSILDNLGNRALNAAGDPSITLNGYNSALARALRNSDYGISDDATAALTGVQQDLQRSSISNSLKSSGSDTLSNLAANDWLMRQLTGEGSSGGTAQKAAAAAIGTVIPGVGTMGGWLGAGALQDAATRRAADQLAQALLNPDVANQLLQSQTTVSPLLLQALRGTPAAAANVGAQAAP